MNSTAFSFDDVRRAISGTWFGDFQPNGKIENIFSDTRETASNGLFFAFKGDNFDAHNFLDKAVANGAVLLCIEKGNEAKVPAGVPAISVDNTVTAFQQLAAFHRNRLPNLRLLALTGSCGKTSTKEMVRAILVEAFGEENVLWTEGNLNNQIGVPRTLLRITPQHQVGIIEMGTNHHGEIEPLASIVRHENALIVSIGNCHLEFLGSLEGVATEKSHIYKFLPQNGTAVIPRDAVGVDIMKNAAGNAKVLTFGKDETADFHSEYRGGELHGSSFVLYCKDAAPQEIHWRIPGIHQAINAAGAAALASTFGISADVIARGLANTTLPGMRMRISNHEGNTWINDAYNANPDSMCATLAWLKEFADDSKLILILGDMGELGEQSEDGHVRVLKTASQYFPKAKIVTVGAKMMAAAKAAAITVAEAYTDSAEAAAKFRATPDSNFTVFMKASRSTGLEKIENALADKQ